MAGALLLFGPRCIGSPISALKLSRFNSFCPNWDPSSGVRVSIGFTSTSGARMSSSQAEATVTVPTDDVLVQYVVLRRDLIDTWPLGSVVTQGCHAAVSAIWSNKDDPHTLDYCCPEKIDSMHKVTLEVKGETQMVNLSQKLKDAGIVHKLWIEQPENFLTCLATKPYPKSLVSSFFKKLKLCK